MSKVEPTATGALVSAGTRGRRAPAAETPPHGSTSRMALLSALCPLASLLWTVGRLTLTPDGATSGVHYGSDDTLLPAARHLGLVECTAAEFANSTASDESVSDAALATWAAIRSTSLISLSVGALCLLTFELYRRDPVVRKYVYDRKRNGGGSRVPPPLMLSRSLWTGEGGDGRGERRAGASDRPCSRSSS